MHLGRDDLEKYQKYKSALSSLLLEEPHKESYIRAIAYSHTKSKTTPDNTNGSRLEKIAIHEIEKEEEREDSIRHLREKIILIERFIYSIEDPITKGIFISRVFQNLRWREVADNFHMSKSACWEMYDNYLKSAKIE